MELKHRRCINRFSAGDLIIWSVKGGPKMNNGESRFVNSGIPITRHAVFEFRNVYIERTLLEESPLMGW